MTDPWSVQQKSEVSRNINLSEFTDRSSDLENNSQSLEFEDSFIQYNSDQHIKNCDNTEHKPLPDSENYLLSLEHKLKNLKRNVKLVDALSEKRDDCMRSMVQTNSNSDCNNENLLELETSINTSDSAVQNLYRQLQPIQPVTVGETVHIVKYDQLEEQRLDIESTEELNESFPSSR